MRIVLSNLVVVGMAATYFLLAVQAEPVTATFGYIFGGILSLSLIAQTVKQAQRSTDA